MSKRRKISSTGGAPAAVYVERDPEELAQDYEHQLQTLTVLCKEFDKGSIMFAAEIAVNLRTLFYDKPDPGRPNTASRSIMFQIDKLDIELIDTAYSHTKAEPKVNIEPASGLVYATHYIKDGKYYQDWKPTYNQFIQEGPYFLPLDRWLNRTLMFAGEGKKYSRLRILKDVANQERGAHRAPKLHPDYFELSRQNRGYASSFVPGDAIANPGLFDNAKIRTDILQTGGALRLIQSVVRQIAHEALLSLLPEEKKADYQATIPAVVDTGHPIMFAKFHYLEDIYA